VKASIITTKTWFLLIGAALLISAGLLNLRQRVNHETPPWDGVEWVDTKDGVIAKSIEHGSAAERAWMLPGDKLIGIAPFATAKAEQITSAGDVQIYLEQARKGGKIHYLMQRPSYAPDISAYWADLVDLGAFHKWTPLVIYINLIGVIFLLVGFFVLFKQGGRAPFVLHFATFSLAAFVFLFYTPVGSYRDLDLAIAFLDSAGLILFPPLFLHFCALYPSRQQLFSRRWLAVLLYVPALVLLGFSVVVFLRDEIAKAIPAFQKIPISEQLIGSLYWLNILHLGVALAASAALLVRTLLKARSTTVRQQVKWVVWGTVLAVTPFLFLYALVYLFGAPTDRWLTDVAVLPLALIPFAFGYSVLRYRLMDVELVVRRVFVYALTTLAIALLIGATVYLGGLYAFGSDQSFTSGEITLRVVMAVLAMAAIVMVAAPFKNFLQ